MADLRHLAVAGAEIAVRVTPRARQNAVLAEGDAIRVHVTTVPEKGKANAAVAELLAEALGIARTRLRLVRGARARDKVYRIGA